MKMETETKIVSCRAIVGAHVTNDGLNRQLGRIVDVADHDWFRRHAMAWRVPRAGNESAIKLLINGFAQFADAQAENGYPIGQDGYFHEHASDMISAMRALLNFEMGRLDCGTLDRLICDIAKAAGVEIPE